MDDENTLIDDEIVNHPLFRLIIQSIQMIPQQNDDILQTTFDEQKVENKPTCNKFIESLNELYITEEDIENKLSCSICQEEFKLDDKVMELPCEPHRHYFHIKNEHCNGILPWLSINNTCPMCRFEFPTPKVEKQELSESIRHTNTELSEEQIAELNINISDNPSDIANDIAINATNTLYASNANASDIVDTNTDMNANNIRPPNFEEILMNINSINQNINMIPSIILPNIQMDTVRNGFSDNDIDEALRRSLED